MCIFPDVTSLELRGYQPLAARLAAFNRRRIFICCAPKVHVVVSKRFFNIYLTLNMVSA